MAAEKIALVFKLEKETKNTFRYAEQASAGKPPIIGALYLQKWYLGNPVPETIKITIEP